MMKKVHTHKIINEMAQIHSHNNGGIPVDVQCPECDKKWSMMGCLCKLCQPTGSLIDKEFLKKSFPHSYFKAETSKLSFLDAIDGKFGEEIGILAKKGFLKQFKERLTN